MYLPATRLSLTTGGGLGDCGCGCGGANCAGGSSAMAARVIGEGFCKSPGMGCTTTSAYGIGLLGLGLFDSMDFTTWGMGEWGVVAVGAYLILSLAGDTRRGVKRVRRIRRRKAA